MNFTGTRQGNNLVVHNFKALWKFPEDKVLYITVNNERRPRSLNQNSYYWSVIVGKLAREFGYTNEECHDALKWHFLRIETPGKPTKVRSTTELSTAEAEEYYENIRRWALVEYSINLPLPNEVDHEA